MMGMAQAKAAGSEYLFTNPGSFEVGLFDAQPGSGIPLIMGLHEGIVISMADGYHRTRRATDGSQLSPLPSQVGTSRVIRVWLMSFWKVVSRPTITWRMRHELIFAADYENRQRPGLPTSGLWRSRSKNRSGGFWKCGWPNCCADLRASHLFTSILYSP